MGCFFLIAVFIYALIKGKTTEMWGSPIVETPVDILRKRYVGFKHFEKLLARYPNIPAIIAHMSTLEYVEFAAILDDYP
jgi:hypothetical protein